MQIFLDNLKIFLPKRRFIKFECVHHKNFDPIVMIYVIICQQLHVLVHRTNLHERRTMDPLSNYCKLTLHDTSNYCQFCAILNPRIFKKFSKFSVFIKTNTNTSLHCATWCYFRARTWHGSQKFRIGENNF